MVNMNIFRILADVSHTASKCILIWAIHSNKSAEGVSLITQLLYIAVFVTRYLDLFWVPPNASLWNFVLKNFYIWSSIYIIILMTRVYARTREREKAWKLGGFATGASLIAAPFVTFIFRGWRRSTFSEMLWTFSIALESVCVLPQLLLLRQTTVPTVIDSFYLVTLGSYRAFYILNWIVRAASKEHHFDPIAFIFGIIQTALYVDFAWVYWTRQRVKLRHGGIVDSEDLRKGWLVNRVLGGQNRGSLDEEEGEAEPETNGAARNHQNRWGARGVSVSADDTLEEHERGRRPTSVRHKANSRKDGERQGMLEEEEDSFSDDHDAGAAGAVSGLLNSGGEWEDRSAAGKTPPRVQ